jgi:ribonuclease III
MTPRNPYAKLERRLGRRFRRRALLEQALTHRSYCHECDPGAPDNQRLEFLGDAVLGLACAALLFHRHADQQEGDLTQARSRIASTAALGEVGARLGLGEWLRLGRGERLSGGGDRPALLADTVEALIGALYLDGGFRAAEAFIEKQVASAPAGGRKRTPESSNPKGDLQELMQKRWRINPVYRVVSEAGPAHLREFRVEVLVRGELLGTGCGASKRAAETEAARAALAAWRDGDGKNAARDGAAREPRP